jgi:hypothetical protein
MTPVASVFTIGYHSVLLFLSHNHPESSVMHSVPAVALAYLLSVIWLGDFAVMVIIASSSEQTTELNVFNFNIMFPASARETQPIQFILAPLEFSLLGDIAIRSTVLRRKRNDINVCSSSSSPFGSGHNKTSVQEYDDADIPTDFRAHLCTRRTPTRN